MLSAQISGTAQDEKQKWKKQGILKSMSGKSTLIIVHATIIMGKLFSV